MMKHHSNFALLGFREIKNGISRNLSAIQTIHMKCQALSSHKIRNKKKKQQNIKISSLHLCLVL